MFSVQLIQFIVCKVWQLSNSDWSPGACPVLLIAGLRISALSQPPTSFLPKPVATLPPPPPPPPQPYPTSVIIRRPSPYYLMPSTPSSPLPPFIPTRALWTLPFWFPVHRLHWSLSFTVSPVPLPSVFRPPDQCRPRTPYPLRILHPLPSTNPPTPLYLTHKTLPTLNHWWFGMWGAQPRHPTDGSPSLMHQPINLHLPTP